MFDATFWVAISFFIFIGLLVYFKIPQNINNLLNKNDKKYKKRNRWKWKVKSWVKKLLDEAQAKLNSVEGESKKILDQAKTESEQLVISMNEKFHKSSEIKKNLTQTKINQMKEAAIKEIKDTSIKIALESVKKIITTTVDKSKLDNLFEKNLEEAKSELKKINS